MTRKKIAVVTERRQTADFFVLEARSCGCIASVFPTLPTGSENYDIVVIDNGGAERSVTLIFKDGSQVNKELPMSVAKLRELYISADGSDCVADENEEKLELFLSDAERKTVTVRDKIIPLTDGEWRVLNCLAEKRDAPVSREELSLLFGAEKGNISDVYICRLRKKLEEPTGIKIITTVREKGYALSDKINVVFSKEYELSMLKGSRK